MLIALIGFGVSAYANFTVTAVNTVQNSSGRHTINVEVRPNFTPTEAGWYTVVVVPTNQVLARVLGSQRQSVQVKFNGRTWENLPARVSFSCETTERPQCTVNDFRVDSWFRN